MNDPVTLESLLLPAAVALVTTLLTTAAGWWWSARRQRRANEAELLAQAYAAVLSYREFAFAVRRRNPDKPAVERIRLSEQMRAVQERIDHHRGWMRASLRSRTVPQAYDQLVAETRKTAGAAIREGWNGQPITTDGQMNMPEVGAEVASLDDHATTYLEAVRRLRFPVRSRIEFFNAKVRRFIN